MQGAFGALLIALAWDEARLRSFVEVVIPGLAMLGGAIVLIKTVVYDGARTGALYRRRREIITVIVSTIVFILGATVAAAFIGMGPTHASRDAGPDDGSISAQRRDDRLGWAPAGKDLVGQRLDAIDHGRSQILLMGDSVMYGHGLPGDQIVSRFLGDKEPGFQVLNGAVSGYSIDQYYLYLKRILPLMRAKAIVVGLFTGNDFQVSALEFSWGTSKPLLAIEHGEHGQDGALVEVGRARGCIDRLSQSLLFRYLWKDVSRARDSIQLLCHPRQLALEEHEVLIARLFDEMESLARAGGATLLFVMLPTRGGFYSSDTDRFLYLSKYRDLRRILLAGHHQMLEFMPERADAPDSQDTLFLDGGHFKPQGHALLAQAIADYFALHPLIH